MVLNSQIEQINKDIIRTKRVIISLGCSFVQGVGAIAEDIYNNYPWEPMSPKDTTIKWNLTKDNYKQLVSQHLNIKGSYKHIEFAEHESDNSFVSILCKKYFNNEYAAINFGINGCGNRATIKELHYYPDILWNEIEEHIVIYCPSGLERFDFISDEYHNPNEAGRWKSIWPRDLDEDSSRAQLWGGYKNHLYSSKFEVLEQIAHIQELLLWCKYKNARLIIVPAFNRYYSKSYFTKSLKDTVTRSNTGDMISIKHSAFSDSGITKMVNMWPWEHMFEPDGCPTFMDLVMKQEFPTTWKDQEHFYLYAGSGSPTAWVTPCAHPSVKGHDIFAQHLYKHITENN